MLVRIVFLVTIITVLAAATSSSQLQSSGQQLHQQQPATVVNSSSPYWRRPGCYRVGHIRTISIPGCVKFNLSTNACRGYCMSYSIPNTMDLGPSAKVEVEPIEDDANLASYVPTTSAQKGLAGGGAKLSSDDKNQPTDSRGEAMRILPRDSIKTIGEPSQPNWGQSSASMGEQRSSSKFNHFEASAGAMLMQVGRQSSPVAGQSVVAHGMSSISGTEKRDVVSVSQCCNMMETEEVVVNLRCGASEIRRLVFKSAKTCECFFCKHV